MRAPQVEVYRWYTYGLRIPVHDAYMRLRSVFGDDHVNQTRIRDDADDWTEIVTVDKKYVRAAIGLLKTGFKGASVYDTQREAASYGPPETAIGNYYVTIRRGGRFGFLAGPFRRHSRAILYVRRAKELAITADPRAAFDSFGTAKADLAYKKPGVFNKQLGLARRNPGR